MKFFVCILLSLFSCSLFAGSLRLYNDSPFKLRAVIRGADGTYLGEMIILPEHFNTWSDQYPSFGPGAHGFRESPNRTMTPYTVYWNCVDGGNFGISTNVATGAAVVAESSQGPRYCKPPEKDKREAPYGPKEGEEQLHQQNEADEAAPDSSEDWG